MTVFSDITRNVIQLHHQGLDVREAYLQGSARVATTSNVRNKPCYKWALFSLAEHGHLKGCQKVKFDGEVNKGARLVLVGSTVLRERPELRKNKALLWRETLKAAGEPSRSQDGLMDLLLELTDLGVL